MRRSAVALLVVFGAGVTVVLAVQSIELDLLAMADADGTRLQRALFDFAIALSRVSVFPATLGTLAPIAFVGSWLATSRAAVPKESIPESRQELLSWCGLALVAVVSLYGALSLRDWGLFTASAGLVLFLPIGWAYGEILIVSLRIQQTRHSNGSTRITPVALAALVLTSLLLVPLFLLPIAVPVYLLWRTRERPAVRVAAAR
jgi:hypothetical protein